MVEGPGTTRNGRKVRVAIGKRVVSAPTHHTVSTSTPPPPPTLPSNFVGELANHNLLEAFSIGKELFLVFTSIEGADVALRLHFGMNGSLQARKVHANSDLHKTTGPAWRQNKVPTLRLYFVDNDNTTSNHIMLETWETTIQFPVSADNARNKYMNNTSRDVCSNLFNAQDVFTCIRQEGNNMIISDTLLNPDICPGVGNIIKIESLHLSKVDPRRIVSSLTDGEIRRIIKHTRMYSMDWLKNGRAGNKLVYNQTICGTCKGMTVKMQKIGGNATTAAASSSNGHAFMSRTTFWCHVCQPFQSSNTTATFGESGVPLMSSRGINNNATNKTGRPQAQCPQHGTKSLKLCRVRKAGQNSLRIFVTCKFKGCQYFDWADNYFPNCKCNTKTILRVSKKSISGGRWFLCCANGDKTKGSSNTNGCGHFEWATEKHLSHIQSLLTPLL